MIHSIPHVFFALLVHPPPNGFRGFPKPLLIDAKGNLMSHKLDPCVTFVAERATAVAASRRVSAIAEQFTLLF